MVVVCAVRVGLASAFGVLLCCGENKGGGDLLIRFVMWAMENNFPFMLILCNIINSPMVTS